MGREHKGKGVNVALGPMMNMGYEEHSFPIMRTLTTMSQPYCSGRS